MNEDLSELLASLKSHKVEFLVIGAHAVAFYGRPRFTQDLDLWINRSLENAVRLGDALAEFGTPIDQDSCLRFANADRQIVRLGRPPQMVDLLNFAGGREFSPIWMRRVLGKLGDQEVFFPSREDLIDLKQAAGRPQDLADVERLLSSGDGEAGS